MKRLIFYQRFAGLNAVQHLAKIPFSGFKLALFEPQLIAVN